MGWGRQSFPQEDCLQVRGSSEWLAADGLTHSRVVSGAVGRVGHDRRGPDLLRLRRQQPQRTLGHADRST